MRKITSLTALLSFIVMLLTSIILYIVPQGRVAYWSDWHLWGLSKTQWGNVHVNFGVLFILCLFLHIYYNWTPILNYLKDKQKNITVFTKNFNIALVITIFVGLGTFFMVPPFSLVIDISDQIKHSAALKYGEPPFGHAEEAPLKSLLKKTGLDYNNSVARLETAGIKIDAPDQIFLDIAKKHGMTPQEVYTIILPKEQGKGKKRLPEIPVPGTGNTSFNQLCTDHQLDAEQIAADLKLKGIIIHRDTSLKELASLNQKTAIQLYDMIKEVSEREGT